MPRRGGTIFDPRHCVGLIHAGPTGRRGCGSSITPGYTRGYFHLLPPGERRAVSVRLDPQVFVWLRAKGEGHLTRINDILANLMEAESRTGPGR